LATDTDIPKFAYRYFCQYFNKVFWLKLERIAYSPGAKQDMKIISKKYWQDVKNFFEQNFNKIQRFLLKQDEFFQTVQ